MKRPLTTLFAVFSLGFWLLAAPASASHDLTLSETGAAELGKLTVMTISGHPGDQYLLIISTSGGPTPIPSPHQPSSIDVGLELINLSFQIPGFIGTIPASGSASVFLPFPVDPILTLITLHFQAIKHNGVLFQAKSNPCILNPHIPLTPRLTLGQMNVQRAGHTVTKLPDGRHLIIGGGADGIVASYGQSSMEVYDPCTQTFEHVGNLLTARTSHSATLLDDGRILVAGGADDLLGEPVDSAELVDPSGGFLSTATNNNLSVARAIHMANLLPDGRVLLSGGTASFNSAVDIINNAHDTTEIFDPSTGSFSGGPNMTIPRVGHTSTTLPSGTVLVAGGASFTSFLGFQIPFIASEAQIFTPSLAGGTGIFSGAIAMTGDRFGAADIYLASTNKVYFFGGAEDNASDPLNPQTTATVETYDIATGTFSLFGTMSIGRGLPGVVETASGFLSVSGGAYGGISAPSPTNLVDLFDPSSGGVIATATLVRERANHKSILLQNGALMDIGGGENGTDPANPFNWDDGEWYSAP